MNIKNVMSNMTDKLKKRDERICTYIIEKYKETEESNCETLSFLILRNMEDLTPDMVYLNMTYHPRLNQKDEFCFFIDGYKPLTFDAKYLERIMLQSFPDVKENTVKKWCKVILEYCEEEYKEIIEIFREAREEKKKK